MTDLNLHPNDQAARLTLLANALNGNLEPAEIVDLVVHQGIGGVHAEAGILSVVREGAVVPVCTVNTLVRSHPIPLDRATPLCVAARENTAVWVRSRVEAGERFPDLAISPTSMTQAWAAIPLRANGEPFAVLGLAFRTPQEFVESDRLFLRTLADLTALALRGTELALRAANMSVSAVSPDRSLSPGEMGQVTAAGPETIDDLALRLRTFAGKLHRGFVGYSGNSGLSSLQYSLLAHLERDGAATYEELAKRERITRIQVQSALVVPIVIDTLIEVTTTPTGGGDDVLSITAAGRSTVERARGAREWFLRDLVENGLDELQRQQVSESLRLLETLLEPRGVPPVSGPPIPVQSLP